MNLLLPPREFIAHSGVSREVENHHEGGGDGFYFRDSGGTFLASLMVPKPCIFVIRNIVKL